MSGGLLDILSLLHRDQRDGGGEVSDRRYAISSDILGATWFDSSPASTVPLKGPLKRGKMLSGEAGYASLLDAIGGDAKRTLRTQWKISELGCKLLTDFKFLKEVPILTILNTFEMVMRGVIFSANELSVNYGQGRGDVDVVFMVENQASKQEMAVGRMRRWVSLMCSSMIEA